MASKYSITHFIRSKTRLQISNQNAKFIHGNMIGIRHTKLNRNFDNLNIT